tara:strand:- start:485 stop:1000 length:516 start_codon:yes stop_codon:yes gene_type:complete
MIHLNIGSNLNSKFGNRFDNITIAINLLLSAELKIKKISNFYETPSYPNKKFPHYLNVGILCSFNENPEILFKIIKSIEKKIGRFKTKKNDPRVCDIDIIDYNSDIIRNDCITIPHSRSHLRNFVLYPIKQIDPNWIHPVLKQNVNFLIKKLDFKSRIEITRLSKNVNISI